MATNDTTENNAPKKRKLSKLADKKSQVVVEQVPDWLRMLLGKYGEAQGRLIGLGDSPAEPDPGLGIPSAGLSRASAVDTVESEELSALLEQMAGETAPDTEDLQMPTSVEWGDYSPATQAPIEDTFARTGLTAEDELQESTPAADWLDSMAEHPRSEADFQADEATLPDWVDESAPSPSSEEPETSLTEADLPDWLSSTLETETDTAPKPETAPDSPPDQPEVTDWLDDTQAPASGVDIDQADVPDWLTQSFESSDSGFEEETISEGDASSTSDGVFDIPDWLTAMAPPAAAAGVAAAVSSSDAEETPVEAAPGEATDWIDESTLEDQEPETAYPAADQLEDDIQPADDIPDWLKAEVDGGSSAQSPIAAETRDQATSDEDWLAGLRATVPDSDEIEEVVAEQIEETDESIQIPDWLAAEYPGSEAAEAVDTPTVEEPSAASEKQSDVSEQDIPDWLKEDPAVVVSPTPEPSTTDEEGPGWLAQADTEKDELQKDDDGPGQALAGAALVGAAALAADTISEPEALQDEQETPDWLADLPPADEPVVREDTTTDVDLPDWLSDLPSADEETPDWLTEADTEKDELQQDDDGPGQILAGAALVGAAALAADAIAEPEALQDEQETPDWLADETPADEPVGREDSTTDEDLPDWLADLPTPEEPTSDGEQDGSDTPDWLSDLPPADEETPDWLAEADTRIDEVDQEDDGPAPVFVGAALVGTAALAADAISEPETLQDEQETPDWLADLPPADEPVDRDDTTTDEDLPDWLADLPTSEEPDLDGEQDGSDTPDWLSDLPPADEETPDWLAEADTKIDEVDQEDDGSGPAVAGAALVGAAALAADAISEPETLQDEQETPDWLADLPAADEETPDWLTEANAENDEVDQDNDDPGPALAGAALVGTAALAADAISEPEALQDEQETPDWLADLPPADEETPDWLSSLQTTEEETSEIEAETSSWLTDQSADEPPGTVDELVDPLAGIQTSDEPATEDSADQGLPTWLADLQDSTSSQTPAIDNAEMEDWLVETATDEESQTQPALIDEDDIEIPDWLGQATLEDLETPDWLEEDEDDQWRPPDPPPPKPPDLQDENGLGPDGPEEGDASSKKSKGESSPDVLALETSDTVGGSPDPLAPADSDTKNRHSVTAKITGTAAAAVVATNVVSGATASAATGQLADQPYSPSTSTEKPPSGESTRPTQVTGMLAGISTLLPTQKNQPAVGLPDTGDLPQAAQLFSRIATTPPQAVVLPQSLSRQEKFAANFVRSALYLLIIVLVSLPLLPGLQRVVNPENDQRSPWTEPSRDFSDVLDSQRRQLISEQLGIIDLQSPQSVALVSFDYSTATQGEMQPLAEAVLARLLGQGMRIIAVSPEPEGAPIAQRTLNKLISERTGTYGESVINLGFLPGQVIAVRRLASGQQKLADIPDFQDNLTLQAKDRENWQDIEDLGQVDMVVTLSDNAATARWWVEQLATAVPSDDGQRYVLVAASASAEPFLSPYRSSDQVNGLIAGINGAAAIEAGRRAFGPARQMIDSLSVASLLIVALIAAGTIVGWMPAEDGAATAKIGSESVR